jgi:hypothetical protein
MSVDDANAWWSERVQLIAQIEDLKKQHDARVTELLTANNVMVEKNRELRRELDICELALAGALELTDGRRIPKSGGIVAYSTKM